MENNKTDKESKEKIQNPSNAEIKLELREYFDTHIRNIRNLEDNLKKDFDQKVEKYKNEIDKTIKRYITIFGSIIIFIGIAGFVGLFTWSKSQINSFSVQTKNNLETDVSTFKDQIKVSLNNEVDSIRGTILSRLDQEFKTENITRLVEDKAKEYTEKKSKKYISNKFKGAMISFRKRMNNSIRSVANEVEVFNNSLINEKITPKIEESDKKLKAIDKQLNEALKRNEELSNFMLTCFKAQSDDSKAFEQLGTWGFGDEKSYPFRAISANIYDSIRSIYIEKIIPSFPVFTWPEGVDPKTFTYNDFKNCFKHMLPRFHADLVRLVSYNINISEENRMELLLDVLKPNISNSLNAKYLAGNILAKKLNIAWEPFNYKPITEKANNRKGTTTTK